MIRTAGEVTGCELVSQLWEPASHAVEARVQIPFSTFQ